MSIYRHKKKSESIFKSVKEGIHNRLSIALFTML